MSSESQQEEQQQHGQPEDGMMCLCNMEDITPDNYVEYMGMPSGKWKPALYEQSVVEELMATQFHEFVNRVKTTDCQAELRRLLTAGPPIHISDKHALPLEDGDTHVAKLWFASSDETKSAKLDGALEGEEREKLWVELRQFIIVEGQEPGDEDAEDAK